MSVAGWVENHPPYNNIFFFVLPFENVNVKLSIEDVRKILSNGYIARNVKNFLLTIEGGEKIYIVYKGKRYFVDVMDLTVLTYTKYKTIKPIYI